MLASEDGTGITLLDAVGERRLRLIVAEENTVITLSASAGKARLTVRKDANGGKLVIQNAAGQTVFEAPSKALVARGERRFPD